MSELTAQNQVVTEAIKQISHIATLPEITVKIIELVEDPTSTAQDLNNVISNDPALCSRILKVVNSSFYGLPGQIGSINRAIVLLGLNAVKNIAISASMAKLFRGGALCDKFNARDIWMHAIATAAASKMISDKLKMGVGTVTDGVPDREMREIERAVFGADHQAFGKALCERWKFPEAFAQVSGFHHNPLDLPTGSRSMACLVHIADHLSGALPGAFRLDLTSLEIDGSILDEIRLSREALADIRSRLEAEVEDVAGMLA